MKTIIVPSVEPSDIIVYSNSYGDRNRQLADACMGLGCRPFHLVEMSGLEWDSDLSPWPAGKIITKSDDFRGNAGVYLQRLLSVVIPEAERSIGLNNPVRILSGYSMAGLFALYAMYSTDAFRGMASVSGSVWYPGFEDYAIKNGIKGNPAIYMSIGDMESRTRSPYLSGTEGVCRRLAEHFVSLGYDCCFELNPGNHFTDMELRIAKAICWLIGKRPGLCG